MSGIHTYTHTKSGVITVIKMNLKEKSFKRKIIFHIHKKYNHQKDMAVMNLYALKNIVLKYRKEKLTGNTKIN